MPNNLQECISLKAFHIMTAYFITVNHLHWNQMKLVMFVFNFHWLCKFTVTVIIWGCWRVVRIQAPTVPVKKKFFLFSARNGEFFSANAEKISS